MTAVIVPSDESDLFFLTEKFVGRLVAWFSNELAAINVQFVSEPKKVAKRK